MNPAADSGAVGLGAPPTPLEDLVIVQISPGEGPGYEALRAGLSSGAVYLRAEALVWLVGCHEVDVLEIGSASLYPASADPIPIWQVTSTARVRSGPHHD